MKLLLTSGGITNSQIAQALLDMVGKKAEETSVAFIPTAANADLTSKEWFIDDLCDLRQQNYKFIDVVDISALPRDIWQPRLEAADVLFFSGGVTPHLLWWVEKSGLGEILPELLKTRVYASISAGSIMVSPTIDFSNQKKKVYYKEKYGFETEKGLGLIDFYIRPHLNSPDHPHSNKDALEEMSKIISKTIYGIDDNTAIKVVDDKVEVVGEGEYLVFNKTLLS